MGLDGIVGFFQTILAAVKGLANGVLGRRKPPPGI